MVVPRTNAALPLWTATDSLWRRYLNEFSSPVASFRRLARSLRNPIVSGPQALDDSMAMGVNVYNAPTVVQKIIHSAYHHAHYSEINITYHTLIITIAPVICTCCFYFLFKRCL